MMGDLLTLDLIPRNSWYNNVRSHVERLVWDIIRFKTYKHNDGRCELCDAKGKDQGFKHDLECHEIWEYDNVNATQTLKGFIALCPLCHKVKHAGLARIKGQEELVIHQLMTVNDISRGQAIQQIDDGFAIWRARNKIEWKVNVDFINSYL